MTEVTESEFQQFVKQHSAVPTEFQIKGDFHQTNFKASGREVGRISLWGSSRVHEVDTTYNTRGDK